MYAQPGAALVCIQCVRAPLINKSLSTAQYSLIESRPNQSWHTIHSLSADRHPYPAKAHKTIHLYNSADKIRALVVQDYGFPVLLSDSGSANKVTSS